MIIFLIISNKIEFKPICRQSSGPPIACSVCGRTTHEWIHLEELLQEG